MLLTLSSLKSLLLSHFKHWFSFSLNHERLSALNCNEMPQYHFTHTTKHFHFNANAFRCILCLLYRYLIVFLFRISRPRPLPPLAVSYFIYIFALEDFYNFTWFNFQAFSEWIQHHSKHISCAYLHVCVCVCVSNVSQQLCACKYPIHYNLLNHNMTFQCIVTNSIALQRSRMHFGIDLICTRQKVRTTHTHTHIYMHTNRFQCLLLWASN